MKNVQLFVDRRHRAENTRDTLLSDDGRSTGLSETWTGGNAQRTENYIEVFWNNVGKFND